MSMDLSFDCACIRCGSGAARAGTLLHSLPRYGVGRSAPSLVVVSCRLLFAPPPMLAAAVACSRCPYWCKEAARCSPLWSSFCFHTEQIPLLLLLVLVGDNVAGVGPLPMYQCASQQLAFGSMAPVIFSKCWITTQRHCSS
jgi:hypothetical protein